VKEHTELLRTETKIKRTIFYRIKVDGSNSNNKSDDKEIRFGSINSKNLILKNESQPPTHQSPLCKVRLSY
jgi:hypothetical protein